NWPGWPARVATGPTCRRPSSSTTTGGPAGTPARWSTACSTAGPPTDPRRTETPWAEPFRTATLERTRTAVVEGSDAGARLRRTGGPSMTPTLIRKLTAEFIGTALLVLVGVGAAVAGLKTGGAVVVALAFGLVLLALAYALGPVSGCHVN